MAAFPDDFARFIDTHFHSNDVPRVYEIIAGAALKTPRVGRAVLLLSNGSLTLLRHYAELAATDVASLLRQAEYVEGVTELPMQVRDLNKPFTPDDHMRPLARPARRGPMRAEDSARCANFHRQLVGRVFSLGDVDYIVAARQTNARTVRCFRRDRNIVGIVALPLLFVLEQLAERIDIGEAPR
jgi:hypothetical protein